MITVSIKKRFRNSRWVSVSENRFISPSKNQHVALFLRFITPLKNQQVALFLKIRLDPIFSDVRAMTQVSQNRFIISKNNINRLLSLSENVS